MKQTLWLLALSSSLILANSSKIDEKTGLIWQDNTEISQNDLNYNDALKYCKNLKVDGFSDWRLPSIREMYSIVDLSQKRPALKNGFEIRDDGRYWTSTLFSKNPKGEAWYISMRYGEAEAYNKSRVYHVRCVREHSTK